MNVNVLQGPLPASAIGLSTTSRIRKRTVQDDARGLCLSRPTGRRIFRSPSDDLRIVNHLVTGVLRNFLANPKDLYSFIT
jgi:hypothetical protein